jgi:hypothetical protein
MSAQAEHTLVAQPDGLSEVPTLENNSGTHGEKSDSKQAPANISLESEMEQKERTIRGFPWFVICTSLYITCFLYGLDTTIAADIQGPVIQAFGQVEQLAWIGAGFPLGSVCVILLLGTLFNTFNMKWVYIATVILFEVGSALCGGAPNMTALIVGRVIAGAGGSGILPWITPILQRRHDRKRAWILHVIDWRLLGSGRYSGTRHRWRLFRVCSDMEMGLLHQPGDWRDLSSSILSVSPIHSPYAGSQHPNTTRRY